MQTLQFIPVAITPEEQALEKSLLEAASRGDELLARKLAEKQAEPLQPVRGREPRGPRHEVKTESLVFAASENTTLVAPCESKASLVA